MVYEQKYESWMILRDVSRSLAKLKTMKDSTKPVADASERIDKFLEYFAVMPLDLDPQGINCKLHHIARTKDERIRWEIKNMS
jgi:hypothetical protein